MLRACLRGANATARVRLLIASLPPWAAISLLSFSDPECDSRCHSGFYHAKVCAVNPAMLRFEAAPSAVNAVSRRHETEQRTELVSFQSHTANGVSSTSKLTSLAKGRGHHDQQTNKQTNPLLSIYVLTLLKSVKGNPGNPGSLWYVRQLVCSVWHLKSLTVVGTNDFLPSSTV